MGIFRKLQTKRQSIQMQRLYTDSNLTISDISEGGDRRSICEIKLWLK